MVVRSETVAKETLKFALIYRQTQYWFPKKTPSKTSYAVLMYKNNVFFFFFFFLNRTIITIKMDTEA